MRSRQSQMKSKSKTILCGVANAVVLQFGVLACSAQTNQYLYSGSETDVTLNPGTYVITAYGAPGGSDFDTAEYGGLGAEMSGEFSFSASTNLTLLVGGGGDGGNGGEVASGGGGGSFVVEGSTPLVIAGGGGGGGSRATHSGGEGANGNVSTNGGQGQVIEVSPIEYLAGGAGGTNGGGGTGGISNYRQFGGEPPNPGGGGGGGGFLGNGGDGQLGSGGYGSGGYGYSGGGSGGSSGYPFYGGDGGYGGGGGGGAADGGGGGGGGYSGGGGGRFYGTGGGATGECGGGGGGGSIIDSSAIANLAEVSGIASPNDPANGEIIIAAGLTWNNAGSAGDGLSWDTVQQNWNSASATTVYANGDNVTFNDSNNATSNGGSNPNAYNVTLNSTVAPASIVVNNSLGNYTISGTGSIGGSGSLTKMGSGKLTLNTVNAYSGGTTISAGKLIVGVNGAVPHGAVSISGGTLQLGPSTGLAQVSSLSISGNGTLDITNNHVIITGDPVSTIYTYLQAGYNGGNWNGIGGIDTSAPLTTNSLHYGLGFAQGGDAHAPAGLAAGQIEVAYTLLGDVYLDGAVNGIDLAVVAANFNQSFTAWDQGDFQYDGIVNGPDLAALAANLNQGDSGAASAGDVAALDAFAAANGLSLPTSSVPEPMSGGITAACAIAFLARRRRPHFSRPQESI